MFASIKRAFTARFYRDAPDKGLLLELVPGISIEVDRTDESCLLYQNENGLHHLGCLPADTPSHILWPALCLYYAGYRQAEIDHRIAPQSCDPCVGMAADCARKGSYC